MSGITVATLALLTSRPPLLRRPHLVGDDNRVAGCHRFPPAPGAVHAGAADRIRSCVRGERTWTCPRQSATQMAPSSTLTSYVFSGFTAGSRVARPLSISNFA